jgi:hypothetical protein
MILRHHTGGIMDRFELEFEGRRYTVERGERPGAAARGGGGPVGPDQWYVTLGPKAITALDALPEEPESALEARIRSWLAEHPEMPDRADIVFGGG